MKHDEFEQQMISRVNRNCEVKEQTRQEIQRAAAEEYRFLRKCKKANSVIGIIVLLALFGAVVFALQAFTMLGNIAPQVAIGIMAVMGLAIGMTVNSLGNRIKK